MFSRFWFAAVLASSALAAGPALTTIQDVLYKADGTRFNGSVTISWNSFQAADNSSIVTQSTTVKVVDGVLRVQLAPTTTATPQVNYSVIYTSDGRVQFQETWSVPSSGQPLHVRDVRIAAATAPSSSGSSAGDTGATPIPESSVIGLIADLGSRPLKGMSYAAGSVAIVDPTGMLASVNGSPSDCVHVDGSSGPCGGPQASFIDSEALSGIVDGANRLFGISAVPDPATSLAIYRNGILQKAGQDFSLTGNSVQFLTGATPQPGDTLLASYRLDSPDPGDAQPFTGPQVLCNGAGGATSSLTLENIGNCAIPSGVLQPGDRLEIRFDVSHPGTAAGFSVEVDWGGTVLVHRDAAALDALVTGSAGAAIQAAGAQLSSLTWGSVLPFAATVGTATGDYTAGLTISFQGKVAQTGDSVTMSNFTVVRIP
ncbi:MAG: hypothetical protein P4L56_15650 [Candidatus Sulfopaludibacter sp.]|nr:hypothetical protein [Candidatus Sulfopaludibacter sp.]